MEKLRRILIDTNILFSALLFPHSKPAKALLCAGETCEIVLCDRNIVELRDIVHRKAPNRINDVEAFLVRFPYVLIPASSYAEKLMRDAKDQPILNAAIAADVDIILTGDKDFLCLDLERPKCMTASQFLNAEGIE